MPKLALAGAVPSAAAGTAQHHWRCEAHAAPGAVCGMHAVSRMDEQGKDAEHLHGVYFTFILYQAQKKCLSVTVPTWIRPGKKSSHHHILSVESKQTGTGSHHPVSTLPQVLVFISGFPSTFLKFWYNNTRERTGYQRLIRAAGTEARSKTEGQSEILVQ